MFNVVFMELAYDDYDEISEYLAQFYPGTIGRFLTELEKYTTILQSTPYAFETYEPYPQYRRMVVHDYLVFYKVFDETHKVEIHRILHGARNIQNILGGVRE